MNLIRWKFLHSSTAHETNPSVPFPSFDHRQAQFEIGMIEYALLNMKLQKQVAYAYGHIAVSILQSAAKRLMC